jgi:hypothetical protein
VEWSFIGELPDQKRSLRRWSEGTILSGGREQPTMQQQRTANVLLITTAAALSHSTAVDRGV